MAVNCGGTEDHKDADGLVYKADTKLAKGGQSTAGCGMHSWKMANSELYHSERWGENFSYEVPLSLARDSQHTLILKFSECYFWEPGMKVFDIKVGETVVAPHVDPFLLSGAKLMPGDLFMDIKVKGGQLYIDGKQVKNGVKDG